MNADTTALRGLIATMVAAALIWTAACSGDAPTSSTPTQPPSSAAPAQSVRLKGCAGTSVGLTPLTDLGSGTYQGQSGGLYSGGTNARPAGHEAAGVTASQVAVAWVKLAEAGPTQGFPQAARILQGNIVTVVRLLKQRFPNLQLAYLSSRIYAGYATSTLNPEPYAYESGFSVRWAIEQLMNDASAPWVSWGPYLWADGTKARSDGLTWACSDLVDDGTHPSTTGRQKVADMLLAFFKSDSTAREWFLANP